MDFDDSGAGPCLLCLPGSFSTSAAWRPVRAALEDGHRVVATSLPGYGGTNETRPADDGAIAPHLAQVGELARRIGAPVHLAAHSFGGIVALAAAMNGTLPLKSLILIDAIPLDILIETGHRAKYEMIEDVARAYMADHAAGDADAARHVIDMWNGAGTYAALAPGPKRHIAETVPVNLRDWQVARSFSPGLAAYRSLRLPVLVLYGADAHPAMSAMAAVLAREIPDAALHPVEGASHFLLHTHAREVAGAIEEFVKEVEG